MFTTRLTAGFLPLFDSALLVLAQECGFAEAEGLELQLVRETSWANIRDRAALGHFEIAQMLAPMPIAANLGLTPIATPMIAPVVLGLGNNGVTVSAAVWKSMQEQGAPGDLAAGPAGQALAKVVAATKRKLRFGVVHQTSSHNYELRYWLAASGIQPGRDIEIVVLPPPLLPDALGAVSIDGYCVGEPWNSVGVAHKSAHIVTVKASIWQSSPDKVIGMRTDWAEQHPDLVDAVVRAIYRAGLWCADPANHGQAARIMAGSAYLDQDENLVHRALSGMLDVGAGRVETVPGFFIPHASAANLPWRSHALWYYTQMVRWCDVVPSDAAAAIAQASFRPDLFRRALAPLGVSLPLTDSKVEGARAKEQAIPGSLGAIPMLPDRFFDGQIFDPTDIQTYLEQQAQLPQT
ncbi:MAG TPA: CmpA/NrtA family ABC transporter substrate-binding protein [Devosia sp.]|jgi:NitT/TauT family transport system ATP-binding protein|uniref:CmpA/NrtA family ABC transporter substrate-binding protein n=1 Tax=Devosia sp. TaxID=1871048 RepID=UPI002F92076F